MKYYYLPVALYFLSLLSVCAQHTISVARYDTIFLTLDSCRGDIQWQISYDKDEWTDLDNEIYDSLKYIPEQFPSYFRAGIKEGSCMPHYSEIVKIVTGLPIVNTSAIQQTGTTNAVLGGNITDIGIPPLIERGIVYGTLPQPTLENASYTAAGTGAGSFNTLLTGLTPNTLYYVRAYATNSMGTVYGEELSFRTWSAVLYSMGDTGPAGGIIFYDKGAYSNGWRYLEAAPAGWSGGADPWVAVDWGCYQTLIGETSDEIGKGKENTERILANGCIVPDNAAGIAAEADIGGYTDWFLPSRDELHALYDMLSYMGGGSFRYVYGLQSLTYTSSSELDAMSVAGVAFGDGGSVYHLKVYTTIAVRPVRRF